MDGESGVDTVDPEVDSEFVQMMKQKLPPTSGVTKPGPTRAWARVSALARKDRDTLIEQSVALIKQSRYFDK